MQSVFDLIGTLAVVVALFILAVTVASALIGRAGAKKGRCALLNAGMSKNMLLCAEVCEYALVGAIALALSVSVVGGADVKPYSRAQIVRLVLRLYVRNVGGVCLRNGVCDGVCARTPCARVQKRV